MTLQSWKEKSFSRVRGGHKIWRGVRPRASASGGGYDHKEGLLGRGKGSRLGHPWSAAFPAAMPSWPGFGPGGAAPMVLSANGKGGCHAPLRKLVYVWPDL